MSDEDDYYVPVHEHTSCELFGHDYEDTDHGTRRCTDCGDEYEID